MRLTKFGIRIRGTEDLFWGPDHLARFKPWPDAARTYETRQEAEVMMTSITTRNTRLNAEYAHLERRPTDLELVMITTTVEPVS